MKIYINFDNILRIAKNLGIYILPKIYQLSNKKLTNIFILE